MILVALHGHPLDRRMWLPLFSELGESVRTFAPDLRGRGTSRRPVKDVHPMSLLADDLVEDLDDFAPGKEPLLLCGLSMGGYVLFEVLRRHGRRLANRVAGLVLCDTKASADDDAARQKRTATVEAIRAQGMETVRSAMQPKLLSRRSAGSEAERLTRAMILETPPAAARADLLGMAQRADAFDVLGAVSVPTLLLFGEEDAVTPPSDGEAMAEGLSRAPHVRFVTIPGAGHMAPLESPRDTASAIQELVSRIDWE